MKTHYKAVNPIDIGNDFAECNYWTKGPLTAIPSKVTCGKCKKTKAYKEMME